MEKADAYHNSIVFLFLWKTRYFYEDGLTNIITGINLKNPEPLIYIDIFTVR